MIRAEKKTVLYDIQVNSSAIRYARCPNDSRSAVEMTQRTASRVKQLSSKVYLAGRRAGVE